MCVFSDDSGIIILQSNSAFLSNMSVLVISGFSFKIRTVNRSGTARYSARLKINKYRNAAANNY